MPSPFPGMDPYLESPAHWSDFHYEFIGAMREALSDKLPENYHARINELVMMIQPDLPQRKGAGPDVLVTRDPGRESEGGVAVAGVTEIVPTILRNIEYFDPYTEAFIEVIRLPDQQVVTVIELFSPANKTGEGRGIYMEKRQHLLRQPVNIVEFDLIRAGRRLELNRPLPAGHYYAFVSRADRRPTCDVYAWTVRQPLPPVPIPLQAPDGDVRLELEQAFRSAYKRGRYDRMIKYDGPPSPPRFHSVDAEWVSQTARAAAKCE